MPTRGLQLYFLALFAEWEYNARVGIVPSRRWRLGTKGWALLDTIFAGPI